MCRDAFAKCRSGWNDYTQSIISAKAFSEHLELAKTVFPQQWEFLSGLRSINTKDCQGLLQYKEWHFLQHAFSPAPGQQPRAYLLGPYRNNCLLWLGCSGVTVVNGSTFWGNTVSCIYRDRQYSEVINGMTENQMKLLMLEETVHVVWDNHQRRASVMGSTCSVGAELAWTLTLRQGAMINELRPNETCHF